MSKRPLWRLVISISLIAALYPYPAVFAQAPPEAAPAPRGGAEDSATQEPAGGEDTAQSRPGSPEGPSAPENNSEQMTPTRVVPSGQFNERLSDNKLKLCQQRQRHINDLIDKSVERSREHLKLFSTIESRVKAFAEKNQFSSDQYGVLARVTEQEKNRAEAAVALASQSELDCTRASSQQPGSTIVASVRGQREALQSYKTAIKQLIIELQGAIASTTEEGR